MREEKKKRGEQGRITILYTAIKREGKHVWEAFHGKT